VFHASTDQKLASAVDYTRIIRNLKLRGIGYGGDMVSVHDHRSAGLNRECVETSPEHSLKP
jgi:hypothetical protein